MRISNKTDLDRLKTDSRVSPRIAAQLAKALDALPPAGAKSAAGAKQKTASKGSAAALSVAGGGAGESKGEASVRLALLASFGDWHKGGEVIQELAPFRSRKFRADFALVRYRISVEVEGWTHHGRSLDDHHGDRLRSMFFAKHDWLVFNLSHGQALKDAGLLIDSVAHAMTLRTPTDRDKFVVERWPHKNGVWYQLANSTI